MKIKSTTFLFLCLLATLISCDLMYDSPEKIFDTIGLNGNKIPHGFERHFNEIRQRVANGGLEIVAADNKMMKKATCLEYMAYAYERTFDSDIENIKNLKVTAEAQPIVEAGAKAFKYADGIYKNDFPVIAKMIDDGKTDQEIDAAIENLDATKGAELDMLYTEMMDLLILYAKKHGVEYKTIDIGLD